MASCPLKSCGKPWADHEGVERIVHSERAERENAVGTNGGRLCDTRSGPCSCGAWH
jgi:hypothetical protein